MKNNDLVVGFPKNGFALVLISDCIGIWKSWFLRRGENQRAWRIKLRARTNNKLDPLCGS